MNACYKLYNTYHIYQDIIVFQPWELQHQTARLVADEFFDQVPIHHSCHNGCKHGWNKKWEPGFRLFSAKILKKMPKSLKFMEYMSSEKKSKKRISDSTKFQFPEEKAPFPIMHGWSLIMDDY